MGGPVPYVPRRQDEHFRLAGECYVMESWGLTAADSPGISFLELNGMGKRAN
jgi:hypothetical protein